MTLAASAFAALGVTITSPVAVGETSSTGCGASEYVSSVHTERPAGWGPDFKVVVTPTNYARTAGVAAAMDHTFLRPIVVSMWHSVQQCVPGLTGRLADSIWQQLECHEMFPLTLAVGDRDIGTGPTYDLESYRSPLPDSEPSIPAYINSHCLNLQFHDGPENGSPGYGNDQPGYLDLSNNVG